MSSYRALPLYARGHALVTLVSQLLPLACVRLFALRPLASARVSLRTRANAFTLS